MRPGRNLDGGVRVEKPQRVLNGLQLEAVTFRTRHSTQFGFYETQLPSILPGTEFVRVQVVRLSSSNAGYSAKCRVP